MNDDDHQICKMQHEGIEILYKTIYSENKRAPILVILHGHGYNIYPANYSNPNWNILCPMDRFGEEQKGSWFLGEDGNHFWLTAMPKLIEHVRQEAGDGDLYFWGSSMGGYGAILHGTLSNARAIYANVPQTLLIGSTYSNLGMIKYFRKLFSTEEINTYNDLGNLIKSGIETTYYISSPRFERKNYLEEQIFRFINKLQSTGCGYYLEIRPTEGHRATHSISEALALFKRYTPPT